MSEAPSAPATLRILVVEDNEDDGELIRRTLRKTPCEVLVLGTLEAGLKHLAKVGADVLLLDLSLPDSHGFETFARAQTEAPGVPIIVLTGLDDEALGLTTVQRGAQDFLPKGEVANRLLHRSIRYAIARKRAEEHAAALSRALSEKNEQFESDLHLAREVQQAFLPRQASSFMGQTENAAGPVRFCHRYCPAGSVGGDFFGVVPISPAATGVLICDVMGHGVRAALVTALLRALQGELAPVGGDPSKVLWTLNRALRSILRHSEATLFTSAFYLVVDGEKGELRYASAGHPSGIGVYRSPALVELLPSAPEVGSALGLTEMAIYTTQRRPIAEGDRLVLYTDGLVDVEGEDGAPFGQERLIKAIAARSTLSGPVLLDELLSEARGYGAEGAFHDDVCLVAIDVARSAR